MNRDTLHRSLEANRNFYERVFAPKHQTNEQMADEKKQALAGLFREMDSRLRILEAEYGHFHKYSPDQPRDDHGRWTSGGGTQTADAGNVATDAQTEGNGNVQVTTSPNSVTIQYPDGSTEVRTGGSLAWRNNNPGNLISGTFADAHGAIGNNAGFAVFPDEDTGQAASEALLNTPTYSKLTIDGAIARRSPPNENDTAKVQSNVNTIGGFSGNEIIGELNSDQFNNLTDAIQKAEGWQIGAVSYTPATSKP